MLDYLLEIAMSIPDCLVEFAQHYKEISAALLSALVISLVAPFVGLVVYFRQRQYELVRSRYLDNGLDDVSADIEYALGVFRHNWARALYALKMYRDAGSRIAPELYKQGYVELEPTSFRLQHSYLLSDLTGDDIFNEALQSLFSFVLNANSFITFDLCSIIRMDVETESTSESPLTVSRGEVVARYMNELDELNEKSKQYYALQSAVHDLAKELSKQRFSLSSIRKFRNRKIVKDAAAKVRNYLGGTIDASKNAQAIMDTEKPGRANRAGHKEGDCRLAGD